MPSYKPSASPCPIGRASRILGDRWAMLILRDALLGEQHFDGWMQRLDISRAVLSDRLAMLCEAGLLERQPATGKRAIYCLSPAGRDIAPIYSEITKWSEKHIPRAQRVNRTPQ